jgi:peptidoglycan/LPS O-acetylase OafA/YrhL
LFGVVAFAALLLTLLHAILRRRKRMVLIMSLAAFACMVATQVIFWMFTYPVNVASRNWTAMPEHFETARRQWEYSHAASAVLTFLALIAIASAVAVDDGVPQSRSSAPPR